MRQWFRAGSASFLSARVKTATQRFYSTPLVAWGTRFMGEIRKIYPLPTISRGGALVQISSMWMVLKNGY
jgi:hypothetical protein